MSSMDKDAFSMEIKKDQTIYLLRHGAVQLQEGGRRYIGWTDLALSEFGRLQARTWADYFANVTLNQILCSDLSRCRETAHLIASQCALPIQVVPEFREISLGTWEGHTFDQIKKGFPEAFYQRGEHIANHRPPQGESFYDLQHRVWPVFEAAVRRGHQNILIVTHAGVIRVLICQLLGMPLENLFSIGQDYGALSIIKAQPKRYLLQTLNARHWLQEKAKRF